MATTNITGEIAARLDRLPRSWYVWRMIVLISLGGVFEFYDLFFTGYVAPGMVKSGLFTPESLGPFAALQVIAVAGFGTFVFATFAGLWVGALFLGSDRRPAGPAHDLRLVADLVHGVFERSWRSSTAASRSISGASSPASASASSWSPSTPTSPS